MTPTKTIADYTAASTIDGSTHYLLIQPGGVGTAYRKINRNTYLGITAQPVDISATQTLSNKTLDNTTSLTIKDNVFTIQDDTTPSKQVKFQLSGISPGQTRTFTFPDSDNTFVGTVASQTLTNKTLTSPTITGGTIDQSTITVDSIAGHTVTTTGTIYGVTVTTGTIGAAALASNSVTTTKIANSTVTADKLATGAVSATVNTQETTTSNTYTSLATTTDSVTVTIGANGLALLSIGCWMQCSVTSGNSVQVSFAGSGANTIAAGTAPYNVIYQSWTNGAFGEFGRTFLLTGLTPGSTTFAAKYLTTAGTATFKERTISVVPL